MIETHDHITHLEIRFNRTERRNALSIEMFDALEAALRDAAGRDDRVVTLLTGAGPAFCSGFDLAPAVENPALMGEYLHRLSRVNRTLRRLPAVVVAAVQGAAIAGGCALLGACDFVFVSSTAKLGYPVHRIGVSPAVTIPTLRPSAGDGRAREILMGGRLVDGREAVRLGLAWRAVEGDDEALWREANDWCTTLSRKGPTALRATKAWLNQLDGSNDDHAFDAAARASAELAEGDEAGRMLREVWSSRRT